MSSAGFEPLMWMIVCEVGYGLAQDVLAHSRESGGKITGEGREHKVKIGLSGH